VWIGGIVFMAMASQTFQGALDFAADAAGALLRDLIDYAGLFPPASLDMAAAVANYEAYLGSEWNWILGRFIVPVARLSEFETAFSSLPAAIAGIGPRSWRLSVLLSGDPVADVPRIREFNLRMAGASCARSAAVESVEVKITGVAEVVRLAGVIPTEFEAYFEFPLSGCGDFIAAVAACGRRAKIRTGGETADKFPAAESAVEFIRLCGAANVAFKATAGLHHPLRSVHRLTYQPGSPSGMMHGFLNVFLAAALLRAGMKSELAVHLLEEQSPEAFHFDEDGISWREHRLSRDEIAAARQGFAASFGSCSFTEPIDDLRSLHWL
jgi:hypothetical protein